MTLIWKEEADGGTNPASHYEGEPYHVFYPGHGEEGSYWVDGTWHWFTTESMKTVLTTVDYAQISGAQASPIRRTFVISDLPLFSKYEIKVENLSVDQTSGRYGDDLYLSAVREILYDQFEYPRHVLVGIRALASDQLSGSLRFSCLEEGSLIRVYDDATETWSVVYNNNPAWVCFDILTQPVFDNDLNVVRYDGMDPSRLILVDFVVWADFCDTLVPDGEGGTEKRITFNGGFDVENNMWEAAIQVCQVGRAILVWHGVKLAVVVDMPGTPVQLFTVGNIAKGSFKETFLPIQDRAAELEIDFINAANDFARDKLTVFNAEIDSAVNKVSMQLFGITKASEAWRAGMYRLACNQYILRSIEKETDIESIACTLGAVINMQHDVPQWGAGGRIVAATETTVTIDKEVTLAAGKYYGIMLRLATDVVVERNVTNVPGTYTVLNVSAPFDPIPVQFDVYAFGEIGKIVKPFRVMNIKREQGTQKATLMLAEYNASIYLTDFDQPAIPTINYSSATTAIPPVENLLLDELILRGADGSINDVIDVFFDRPKSSVFAYAEIWHDCGAGWVFDGKAETGYGRINNVTIGVTYWVAVMSVNGFGQKQTFDDAAKAMLTTAGKMDPPSNVTLFWAKQNGDLVDFSWTHIPDADMWGYELRQGLNWDSALVMATGIQHNHYSLMPEMDGTYRYLLKAIDDSGLYSLLAVAVDITVFGIDEHLNTVLSRDELTKSPPADGDMVNFIYVPLRNALMMPWTLTDSDIPDWTDTTPEIASLSDTIILSASYTSLAIDNFKVDQKWIRLRTAIDASDTGATDASYPTRTDDAYPNDTDDHLTMPVTYELFYQISDDNVTYTDFDVYHGPAQETFRYDKIKLEVTIASQTGRVLVTSIAGECDVPDRIEVLRDLAIAAGTGTDIDFSPDFYVTPIVRPFVKNSAISLAPSISALTEAGCHIDLLSKTDAITAGTVDVEITGY